MMKNSRQNSRQEKGDIPSLFANFLRDTPALYTLFVLFLCNINAADINNHICCIYLKCINKSEGMSLFLTLPSEYYNIRIY